MCVKHTLKQKGLDQRKGGTNEFKTICMETISVKCLTGLLRENVNVRNTMILKMGIVCRAQIQARNPGFLGLGPQLYTY